MGVNVCKCQGHYYGDRCDKEGELSFEFFFFLLLRSVASSIVQILH